MSAGRILSGLETSNATGAEAEAVARMGFLEWVFAEPDAVTARAARVALDCPEARNAVSPAAQAFVGFLKQAGSGGAARPVRRRRRALALH